MILVDGSSVLHRVLHTDQADLKDEKGRHTGGVHGFLVSLGATSIKNRLRHQIIVGWDLGLPLFRRELYSEYKAKKVSVTAVDAYKSETDLIKKDGEQELDFTEKYIMARHVLHKLFLPKTGCISIQVEDCEADDIIAYIIRKITDEEIIILTEDRDLIQLLRDNVSIYSGRLQQNTKVKDVIEVYKLEPDHWCEQWMLARAIFGDHSDGIKGIGKIGLEAAIEYARQIVLMGPTDLPTALSRLVRVPRGRVEGYEALKVGSKTIKRNMALMDLTYPYVMNLPIIKKIETSIAGCFIYDMDPETVELKLHSLQMIKAKSYAEAIITSNSGKDTKEYIRRLS